MRGLPWLFGVVATLLAAKNLIGGYGDLGIYLDAARELRTGGVDLWRARTASGPWPYPHVVLLPIAALQAVMGDAALRWFWCLGLGVATGRIVADLRLALRPFGGLRWWQWAVFGVLFQRCVAQNLTHGQLSLWVGACMLRGVVCLQDNRTLRGSAWLGAAAAMKLTPIAFVIALPLMGRGRAALATAAVAFGAVVLLPWPFLGADHWRHLGDFYRAMIAPLLPGLTGGEFGSASPMPVLEYHAGVNVSGTLDYLLQARPVDVEGHRANLFAVSDATLRLAKLVWSATLGALLASLFWRARRCAEGQRLALQASAVMLAIVFFSPLTRIYHLAGALLPFALFCRGPSRDPGGTRHDWHWFGTALAILLCLTLRQKSLLGEYLWRRLEVGGDLHFALVSLTIWLARTAACRVRRAE